MYDELSSLDWVKFPEFQNTNYNYFTFDKLRDAPKRWLCSLPMFEYAHVLCVVTAMRCGGKPERYIDDLYKKRMNPILRRYYDALSQYRFDRALLMRKYESMKSRINGKYLTSENAKIRAYAMKTRKALRGVCKDFEDECRGLRTCRKRVKDTTQDTYPI